VAPVKFALWVPLLLVCLVCARACVGVWCVVWVGVSVSVRVCVLCMLYLCVRVLCCVRLGACVSVSHISRPYFETG